MKGQANALQEHLRPQLLGYAGVLPVAGLLILAWSNTHWQSQALTFASVYGALILSFLGGIHWGFATTALPPQNTSSSVLSQAYGLGPPWPAQTCTP